jgi:hypothetical protein
MGLFKPAWMGTNPTKGIEALRKITKSGAREDSILMQLRDVLEYAPLVEVKRAALQRLDYATDTRFAFKLPDTTDKVKRFMVENSASQGFLNDICGDASVSIDFRIIAASRLTDYDESQDALYVLAKALAEEGSTGKPRFLEILGLITKPDYQDNIFELKTQFQANSLYRALLHDPKTIEGLSDQKNSEHYSFVREVVLRIYRGDIELVLKCNRFEWRQNGHYWSPSDSSDFVDAAKRLIYLAKTKPGFIARSTWKDIAKQIDTAEEVKYILVKRGYTTIDSTHDGQG